MLDLISLIVTLIIMVLFGIGILMMLVIMSHEKTELEIKQNEEDEIDYVQKWMENKRQKKAVRKQRINNFIMKIKKFFTRR